MPSSAAFFSLVPALAPATTMSVALETAPDTLAPRRSACALASSRVMRSSVPVNTTVLPLTGLVESTASIVTGVTSFSRASTTALLFASAKKATSWSIAAEPIPSMFSISALASAASAVPPPADIAIARIAAKLP